jgi:hypothetical protein
MMHEGHPTWQAGSEHARRLARRRNKRDYGRPMSTTRTQAPQDVVITHPNRDTAAAKTTRLFVIGLLVASAVLVVVLTWGAWGRQTGALGMQLLFAILFTYFAYAVVQWRAGVLPIAAGVAIFSGVFAAVTVGGWFDRNGTGYESSPLPPDVVGVLLMAYAILQLVVVVITMRAFTQQWQVELEVPRDEFRGAAA